MLRVTAMSSNYVRYTRPCFIVAADVGDGVVMLGKPYFCVDATFQVPSLA